MSKPTAKTVFAEVLSLHPAGATIDTIVEHAAAQGVTCKPATLAKYSKELGADKIDIGGSTGYRLAQAPEADAAPAPCAPAPCAPAPAETKAPAAPKVRARSRVDVTIEAMQREQGVTVAELVELFDAEFGAGTGKRSTASQAVFKCPKSRGLTVTKAREEGREGIVYRVAS